MINKSRAFAFKARREWGIATRVCVLIAASALGVPSAIGQSYPTKPIRLIIANTTGTSVDTLARVLFMQGQKEEAIELQGKAVHLAEGEMKKSLQKTLDGYRKGELTKAD